MGTRDTVAPTAGTLALPPMEIPPSCRLSVVVCLVVAARPFVGLAQTRPGTPVQSTTIRRTADRAISLIPIRSIGSEQGEGDAFGRIAQVAIRRDGSLVVLDPSIPAVLLFGPDGRYRQSMARKGDGPGEVRAPAYVANIRGDSLVVFDAGHRRGLVYDAALRYVRTIRFPPHLAIRRLIYDSTADRLLASGFGPGEKFGVHALALDGTLLDRYVPTPSRPELLGFQTSFLAGFVAPWRDGGFVFADQSPYRLRFYDARGRERRRCVMDPDPTDDPAQFVFARGITMGVRNVSEWKHVAGILLIPGERTPTYIVPVMTGREGRQYWDFVTESCERIARFTGPTSWYYPSAIAGDAVAIVDWGEVPMVHLARLQLR